VTPPTTVHSRARLLRLGFGLLAVLLALVMLGTPVAVADSKSDYQQRLEDANRRQEQLRSELEGTDERLAETYLALEEATERLPQAEADLAAAENELAAAQRTEQLVADRLEVAQNELEGLAEDLAASVAVIEATRASIGELARSTYRGGTSLSSLHVVLDAGSSQEFIQQTALTDRAVRNQTQVISELETNAAVNRNREARQEAVRERVDELHREAEAAVTRADQARAQAQQYADEIRELRNEKEALAEELELHRVELQEDFETMQRDAQRLADRIAEIEAEERRQQRAEEERRRREAAERAAERAARDNARPTSPPANSGGGGGGSGGGGGGGGGSSGLITPVPAPVFVTSPFGMRMHPLLGYRWMHEGVDLRSRCGEAQVAAAGGTVTATIPAPGNASHGNQVIINHGRIGQHNYVTVTNHLSRFAVRAGQRVSQGQVVGYTGATGNVTGCHVHFEVWRNGSAIDPMRLPAFTRRN